MQKILKNDNHVPLVNLIPANYDKLKLIDMLITLSPNTSNKGSRQLNNLVRDFLCKLKFMRAPKISPVEPGKRSELNNE